MSLKKMNFKNNVRHFEICLILSQSSLVGNNMMYEYAEVEKTEDNSIEIKMSI